MFCILFSVRIDKRNFEFFFNEVAHVSWCCSITQRLGGLKLFIIFVSFVCTSSHVKLSKVKWHFPFGCHCLTHKMCCINYIGALSHTISHARTHTRTHSCTHTRPFLFACLVCVCIELISHEKFHVAIGTVLYFIILISFPLASTHNLSWKRVTTITVQQTADKSAAIVVFIYLFSILFPFNYQRQAIVFLISHLALCLDSARFNQRHDNGVNEFNLLISIYLCSFANSMRIEIFCNNYNFCASSFVFFSSA